MPRIELISHGRSESGPSRMLQALAAALREAAVAADVAVVDRPAGDGTEAITSLASRPGDDRVAGSCTPTYLTTPAKRHLAVTYRDLTPLGRLVADTYLLVTRHDAPWADAAEMLSRETTAAAAPRGGNTHIQALLIGDATGHPVHLQFHPGLVDATTAVAEGRADWTSGVATDFSAAIDAGQLRIVASLAAADEPNATADRLVDQGIDVVFQLWRGLIGPGGLDPDQIRRWERWLAVARGTYSWSRYLIDAGVRDAPSSAADFNLLLDREAPLYLDWLQRLGALS